MNLELDYTGFEKYLLNKEYKYDGVIYIFKFENGYGASVIKDRYSYGSNEELWELAIISFNGAVELKPYCDEPYDIEYSTPISDDVMGWLSDLEVKKILREIQLLD